MLIAHIVIGLFVPLVLQNILIFAFSNGDTLSRSLLLLPMSSDSVFS